MGIFSGKKKTYVSSIVYNMAGDEFKRPNYLKTSVVSAILDEVPSLSEAIVGSYIQGPAMRFRHFYKWADPEYNDIIGLVAGEISTGHNIDAEVVEDAIPPSSVGAVVNLQSVTIGPADYTYWADQYVLENYPERIDTDYVADINETTNEITITWEDDTTTSFMPLNYEKGHPYMYATYTESFGEVPQAYIPGPVIDIFPSGSFPSTVGWDVTSFTDDGLGTTHGVYERLTFIGPVPSVDATYSLREVMFQDETPTTKTYQIDTQEIWHSASTSMMVLIYKYGDGNADLDAMFGPSESVGGFYPVIPVRLDNKFLSETYMEEVYEMSKKGYRKATTGKYDDLIEQLDENENIDDIDYIYTMFGVCLNVLEQASRRYVYEFFRLILEDYTGIGTPEYVAWQIQWTDAKNSWDDWTIWREAQEDPLDPLYGTPEPEKLAYPTMPANSIRVSTADNPTINYDITISWNSITEISGTGLLKPDAKPDQLWFTKGDQTSFDEVYWGDDGEGGYGPIEGATTTVDEIFLNWQLTANTWSRLRIVGLLHKNAIYGGKSVDITAFEALDDPEESGFIIPLHDGVFRAMGMKDGTQMCTANCFLVMNCYEVVKQKWYQTGLFRIILIIIILVISYFTGGLAASSGAGLLGTNAAVGTAILGAGASAVAIAVVGAIANAIAAIIVTKLITMGATKLFGEQWGAIIGTIASIITLQVGSAMASGQTMASSFAGLMRADNILMLTQAAGEGYAAYLRSSTAGMALEQAQVVKDYEKKSREIREAWITNLGGGNGVVDPAAILSSIVGVPMESMDSFLQRTLMTGSEVADMSLSMLTNFADMTLSTDLPT